MKFLVVFLTLAATKLTVALYTFDNTRQVISKRDVDSLLLADGNALNLTVENLDAAAATDWHDGSSLSSESEQDDEEKTMAIDDDFATSVLHSRSPPGSPKSPKPHRISPDSPKPPQQQQQQRTRGGSAVPGKKKDGSISDGWVVLRDRPQSAKGNQDPSPKPGRVVENAVIAGDRHGGSKTNLPSTSHPGGIDMSKIDMHAFDSATVRTREKAKKASEIGTSVPSTSIKGKKRCQTLTCSSHSHVSQMVAILSRNLEILNFTHR